MIVRIISWADWRILMILWRSTDLRTNETLRRMAGNESDLENPDGFGLENFTYKNMIVAETIFSYLEAPDFTGLTVCLASKRSTISDLGTLKRCIAVHKPHYPTFCTVCSNMSCTYVKLQMYIISMHDVWLHNYWENLTNLLFVLFEFRVVCHLTVMEFEMRRYS